MPPPTLSPRTVPPNRLQDKHSGSLYAPHDFLLMGAAPAARPKRRSIIAALATQTSEYVEFDPPRLEIALAPPAFD